MRPTPLAVLVLLAACTKQPVVQKAPAAAEASVLALPVTAPMQARERMLHDIGKQKVEAGRRASEFEAVTEPRDR